MAEDIRKKGIYFSPLQTGYLVSCIDPIDIGECNEAALTIFRDNPGYEAIPVKKDGEVIGVAPRTMLDTFDGVSARMRAWLREIHLFVIPPRDVVDATVFISTLVDEYFRGEPGKDAVWYIVQYNRQYMGIISLQQMLKYINTLRAQDMTQAREIQKNLLERAVIQDDRIQLLFYNKMANEIGGDFYQVFQSWKGQYMVACFDVAAQNISGSLAAMVLGSCFETLVLSDFEGYAERMTQFINTLVKDVNPAGLQVTAVFFYIDFSTMTVKIHSCGFSPIYIFSPLAGEQASPERLAYKVLQPNLPPLGLHDELDVDRGRIIAIRKGLRITTNTDGLNHMVRLSGEAYGDRNIFKLLKTFHKYTQSDIPTVMDNEISRWLGEAPLVEDITLMDMRFV
jgi:sigma-B regulation protein RsbU (phosphoserine phosphatase)